MNLNTISFLPYSSKANKGVCHTLALPFTLKRMLMQKKNYGNSNISPYKKYIPNLQKNPLKETKILQDIITLYLISSFNTSQNIKVFQKSSYKNRPNIIT
jgi:hypothetical protein